MSLFRPRDKQFHRFQNAVLFVLVSLFAVLFAFVVALDGELPTFNRVGGTFAAIVAAAGSGWLAYVLFRRWWRNTPSQSARSS